MRDERTAHTYVLVRGVAVPPTQRDANTTQSSPLLLVSCNRPSQPGLLGAASLIMTFSFLTFFLFGAPCLLGGVLSFQAPAKLISSRLIQPTSLAVSPLFATSTTDIPPTRSAASSSSADSIASRAKRTTAFTDWARSNDIQIGGVSVEGGDVADGLGLVTTRDVKPGDVVVTVPTNVVLSVTSPGEYNRGARELFDDKNVYRDAPWWAQLSVQLNRYDKVNSIDLDSGIDMRGWLDSLPRTFDTPIHWSKGALEELQYTYLSSSIASQKRQWYDQYQTMMRGLGSSSPLQSMTFADFVWGAENARSRAFSGSYGGSAFNPLPYGLTILLVAAYVGLGIGSLEQAANGAAVVICGSILKDFVLPKLSKVQKYIICPFIDMSNHKGIGESGDVAFEYFGDAYSLSITNGPVAKGEELFISYGPRSNDQLLKYYGFVEENNPHDVYIMPQLREWDVSALEAACGRQFSAGRLAKLEKAGLLGFSGDGRTGDNDDDDAANTGGGVVVSRAGGIDGAIMQALRALVASDEEWDNAGEAIGNFAADGSGGPQTEQLARLTARTALEMELASKPTTIEEDKELLKRMDSKAMDVSVEEKMAVLFRIEKKKLLKETIDKLT